MPDDMIRVAHRYMQNDKKNAKSATRRCLEIAITEKNFSIEAISVEQFDQPFLMNRSLTNQGFDFLTRSQSEAQNMFQYEHPSSIEP